MPRFESDYRHSTNDRLTQPVIKPLAERKERLGPGQVFRPLVWNEPLPGQRRLERGGVRVPLVVDHHFRDRFEIGHIRATDLAIRPGNRTGRLGDGDRRSETLGRPTEQGGDTRPVAALDDVQRLIRQVIQHRAIRPVQVRTIGDD
jgi:hypothetical protein